MRSLRAQLALLYVLVVFDAVLAATCWRKHDTAWALVGLFVLAGTLFVSLMFAYEVGRRAQIDRTREILDREVDRARAERCS